MRRRFWRSWNVKRQDSNLPVTKFTRTNVFPPPLEERARVLLPKSTWTHKAKTLLSMKYTMSAFSFPE